MDEVSGETRPGRMEVHRHIKRHADNTAARLKKEWRVIAAATLIYLVISLINFWPVTANMASTVAGTGGDPYQMLWHIWWVGHSVYVTHTSIWSTTLVFWPLGANLIYETMMPIGSLLVYPFSFVSLAFSYNVLFFLGFVLSGLTMFLLARYLTSSNYAAFFAGLFFAFSAFHISQAYGHLEWANIEWIPLAIYFFIRMAKDHDRYANAIGLAVALLLALFMGDIEGGVMALLTIVIIGLWYLISSDTRRSVLNMHFASAVGFSILVVFILGAWAFIPIIGGLSASGSSATLNALSDVQHNMLWSDDFLSFLLPSYYNGIFQGVATSYANIYHGDLSETTSYITYTVLILAIAGIYRDVRRHLLWIFIAVLFGILALGPIIQIGGTSTGLGSLYYIFKYIPVLNIIREPGRLDLIVTIALSVLAAFGIKYVEQRVAGMSNEKNLYANTLMAFCAIAVMFLVESNGIPFSAAAASHVTTQVQPVSQFYSQVSRIPGNFSVLQLPVLPNQTQPELYPGKIDFYTTVLGKPMIGGYTTRENQSQLLAVYNIPLAVQATGLESNGNTSYQSPVMQNFTAQTLLTMYNYDIAFVAVDKSAYNLTGLEILGSYLEHVFGQPVYNDNSTVAFSTLGAINSSIYRQYLGYPILSEWGEERLPGTLGSIVWVPVNNGDMLLYAPYPNVRANTSIYPLIYSNRSYAVNSMISFDALSLQAPNAILYIGRRTVTGVSTIATLNVTPQLRHYQVNTTLLAGTQANYLLFVGSSSNAYAPIGIVNLTFSNAR
ncbi:MAG: hypothetical protein KGH72_05670 [Candidatus Micrarchaeota archaeon]|nr:hypothetical protein [Candidatus Micrarchaeota archaeon]